LTGVNGFIYFSASLTKQQNLSLAVHYKVG